MNDAARRSKQAARAGAESDLLVTTAGSILRGEQPLQAVVDRVREAFGMETVTLLERRPHARRRRDSGRMAGGRDRWRRATAPAGRKTATSPCR